MSGSPVEMARRRVPTWFVTAPHRRQVLDGGEPAWAPYGAQHARRVGDPRTACGRVALGWVLFWEMPFASAAGRGCPACAQVTGATPRRP